MVDPVRREIRTRSASTSIWQPSLTETDFRTTAVDLALATNECPIEADIGLGSPLENLFPQKFPKRALTRTVNESRYVLPVEIEHRLANDFALIAATEEAVFSVTAGSIEEHVDRNGHLDTLTLRLAANEGISEGLKASLYDVWDTLVTIPASLSRSSADLVFEKIVHLNRKRILQRVRKAVGHPPIFREKGRTRTNPDDKLLRAFVRMRKEKLTATGQAFVDRATVLNAELLHFLVTISVDDVETTSAGVMLELCRISKRCFDVTTTCDSKIRVPFKHLLKEAGLDQRTWLKNKHVAEIDKIGAYWRIAQSLVCIYRRLMKPRPASMSPIRLLVEGIQPYGSIMQGPSIQGRDMACYVHAEVQLMVHYLVQDSRRQLSALPPRVIGASKSACFLCYLFISCHGAVRSPPTHGRLYDQWTIPDLKEYTGDHASDVRATIVSMQEIMLRLQQAYSLKRPRDFPMTSRTDLDRLSIFADEATKEEIPDDSHGKGDAALHRPQTRKLEKPLPRSATSTFQPSVPIKGDAAEQGKEQPGTIRPPPPLSESKTHTEDYVAKSSHALSCFGLLWSRLFRQTRMGSKEM